MKVITGVNKPRYQVVHCLPAGTTYQLRKETSESHIDEQRTYLVLESYAGRETQFYKAMVGRQMSVCLTDNTLVVWGSGHEMATCEVVKAEVVITGK